MSGNFFFLHISPVWGELANLWGSFSGDSGGTMETGKVGERRIMVGHVVCTTTVYRGTHAVNDRKTRKRSGV